MQWSTGFYTQPCKGLHLNLPAFFLLLFVFFSISSPVFPLFLLLLRLLFVFVLAFVFLPDYRKIQRDWGRRTGGTWPLLLTVAPFWRPGWKRTENISDTENINTVLKFRFTLDQDVGNTMSVQLTAVHGQSMLFSIILTSETFKNNFSFNLNHLNILQSRLVTIQFMAIWILNTFFTRFIQTWYVCIRKYAVCVNGF